MAARKTASALVAAESEDSGRMVEGEGVMRTVDVSSEALNDDGLYDVEQESSL